MKCSKILIRFFILICCILTTEASITNYFFRPNENMTNLADILKSGQEIIKLRLNVLELNLSKENQTVNEIDRKLQNIEDILKQQQNVLNEVVTNNNALISAKLQMETSSTKSADTDNNASCLKKPNAAATVFFTDILKEDEPTVCKLNADGISECSLMTLPTTCENSRSINCVNNKCRVRNRIFGGKSFWVSCSGEWTVIQRRINGSVNFYRNWNDYKRGFGDLDGELWIGLDKLHSLTNISGPVELYIQLQDFHNVTRYAIYDSLSIGNESTGYYMKPPGKYTGDAGDSFYTTQTERFSTYDQDNDKLDKGHCAELRQGGWWYWTCNLTKTVSNLNGHYYEGGVAPNYKPGSGIYWHTFGGPNQSLKYVEMKIRLKNN